MSTESDSGTSIVMYGADWCGDCRRAKAWLTRHGVSYTEVDLVEQPEATDRILERNGGVRKIPMLVFPDDSFLLEPTDEVLEAQVRALRIPFVIERPEVGRFDLVVGEEIVGFATYGERDGTVAIPHVETHVEHRGNGRAGQLMDALLRVLDADGRRVRPLCPFARQHLAERPELARLLAVS